MATLMWSAWQFWHSTRTSWMEAAPTGRASDNEYVAETPDKTENDLQVSLDLLHPLMADVERKLRRYCYLPSPEAYVAVTVWIVATHVAALLRSAPGLVITAPMGRSARSRLLSVVSAMTRKPLIATPIGANGLDLYRTASETFDPATVS